MAFKRILEIENHQIYTTTTPKTDKGIGRASNPISVVNPNDNFDVGDKFISSSEDNVNALQNGYEPASEIYKRIQKTCAEHNIDIKKLGYGIQNITGLTVEDGKKKLSPEEQSVLYSIVELLVNRAVKEHKNKNIDITDAILDQAYIVSECILKEKAYKDLKSFDKDVNNLGEEFINAVKKVDSREDIYSRIIGFDNNVNKWRADLEQQIEKLPKEQQADARKKQAIKERYFRKFIHARVTSITSNDTASKTLSIVNREDFVERNKKLYGMQRNDEARKELANNDIYENDLLHLKIYQARGENLQSEDYQSYVQTKNSWKDADALDQYYEDFKAAIDERQKYSFLTDDIIKATYQGIGVGAQINHVMTSEQKTAFVEKWTSDVKEYYGEDSKEYKELKSYVEQKVEEYNKALQNKSEGGINKSSQGESTKQASVSYGRVTDPFNANRMLAASVQSQFTKSVTPDANKKSNESTNAVLSSTSSPKDIAKAIETGEITIVEALSKCKEKGYEAIFESPDLFAKNKTIADLYIGYNKKDLKKMLELSNFSSAVALIAKRISPTIRDEYQQKVQLSWTERQAIFGEENKHEVV